MSRERVDRAAAALDGGDNVVPLTKPTAGVEIVDTDLANARRLVSRHGDKLRYVTEIGWLVWDGRRFAPDPKGILVQRLAKETAVAIYDEIKLARDQAELFRHARKSQSRAAIEAMESLARSEDGVLVTFDVFDADPMLLNVMNGTLDLRTGELRPHRRADLLTKLAPVNWDPAADSEIFDAFLWRIVCGDQDLYAYLNRLIGYLLTGLTGEQVIAFFLGAGANGKSTLCEVLAALLGEYCIQVMPEMVMARKHAGIPNDVAALRGRRVAFMNETSQGSRFDEAKLKHLTGGDSLTGRFLHREFFDFRPTHKLCIRGNHKPGITGTDEGIWRRIHLVPFDAQIAPADQDKALGDKLRAELPGILRWAVEGCLAWQRDGLQPPESVIAAVRDYRAQSDVLGRFLEERCEATALAEIKSSALFSAYRDFCERSAERWIPSKDLPGEMARRGFTQKRMAAGQMYLGVRLKSAEIGGWDASV